MATLAKHRNQAAAAPSDADAGSPTPRGTLPNSLGDETAASPCGDGRGSGPVLQWAKPEGNTLRSVCGRYSINRIEVGPFKTYELWKMVPSGNWFTVIRQGLGSSAEAKALAEAHLKANP